MDTITSSSSSHHLTGAASPYSLSPPQSLVLPPHPTGIHLINVLSWFSLNLNKRILIILFWSFNTQKQNQSCIFSIFISSNDPTTNGNFDLNWLKN
jgi:hypothetical protein